MRIDICRANDGIFYDFTGEIAMENGDIMGRDTTFETPISVTGRYVTKKGDVYITSKAECDVVWSCDRCLEPVKEHLVFEVDETFVMADGPKADDEDVFTYESNLIVFDEAVKESLYLAIPTQVLCREDCKGLCPVCGCDLNDTTCTCLEGQDDIIEAEETNNPFAVLKDFDF